MKKGSEELLVLYEIAAEFDIALTERHLDLFRLYLDELWAWNKRVNITGLATRKRVITELFLDSLIPAPLLPAAAKLLDVGSGGGFPGIPLKIFRPHLIACLLEANAKRVNFLKQLIRLLQLTDIMVIRGRIENYAYQLDHTVYDIVTARALANPRQTIIWCAPFLSAGGLLVLFLGAQPEKELAACEEVMKDHGLAVYKRLSYSLPGKTMKRNTVILTKR